MNEAPLVSAIITTHNRKKLLELAINSVFTQTYENIECIVVDDASTDNTKDYCSSLKNLIYIPIKKEDSKGGNYARNVGIMHAHGELIAFLDDDDEWFPEKIEKQVMLMMKNQDVGFVYCGRIIEKETSSGTTIIEDYPRISARGDMSQKILSRICCVTSEILVKRDLLLKVGCFDESIKFWQEYELTIRLFQITKIDYVNECLVKYRVYFSSSQKLSNKYDGWLESVNQVENKHANLYKSLPLFYRIIHKMRIFSEASVRIISSNNPNLIKRHILQVVLYKISVYPMKQVNRLFRKMKQLIVIRTYE